MSEPERLDRPELEKKIHDITSLLVRRVVGEASRKNLRGSVAVQFNTKADTELLDLIDPEQIRKEERQRIADRIEVDMPSITRYKALQYIRDLWHALLEAK